MQDGFLTLSDRSKDVIISGGTNIYPREVEEALLTHPDVREVSAIGVPDPDWGEIVVACVVLEQGASADDGELDAHCLASIARFKRPKRYVYLDALPKNNYGKVLKTELRVMMKLQKIVGWGDDGETRRSSCPAKAGHPVFRAVRRNRDASAYWIVRLRGR